MVRGIFIAWLLPFGALAQEQAAFEPLPGFEILAQDAAGVAFTREYVPDGQGAADWDQRLTHQRMPDWADGNPIEFLRLAAGDMQADCPEVGFRVANGRVPGGYPNAAIFGRCPWGRIGS